MKKFLSLVLALVMTMSLVTVSAGAKDFTDDEAVTYDEAVAVMSEVKVLDGYTDGSFKPQGGLTRGAAAKIICNLILGPTTAAELHADTAPYKDVAVDNTFAGYIAYCAKEGIISGYADGTFRPSAPLTGYAFMKMLLGALGYDQDVEGFTGANWSINVAKRALGIGLNKGLVTEFSGIKSVTREEAALYAFNTLKATMVDYESKTTVSVGGADIVIAGSTAKEVEWPGYNNADGNVKNDDLVQFAEKYFPKLKAQGASDDFGRPATKWVYNKKDIGTYVNWNLKVAEYTVKVEGGDAYNDLDSTAVKEYDLAYYINGVVEKKIEKAADAGIYKKSEEDLKETGKGVLTEIFVNDDTDDITIVVIDTYLAKVASEYSEKNENIRISVYNKDHTNDTTAKTVKLENVSNIADFEKDDLVLVTIADGVVMSMAEPEVVEDATITKYSTNDGETSKTGEYMTKITADGTQYEAEANCNWDAALLSNYAPEQLDENTFNIYLDPYGYVIGLDAVGADDTFVFVASYKCDSSVLSKINDKATIITTEGVMDTVEIKMSKSLKAQVDGKHKPGYIAQSDEDVNRWYRYTMDGDVMVLEELATQLVNATEDVINGVINSEYTSLKITNNAVAFGNAKSVYITVDTDDDFQGDWITDVETVGTGIKNVDIKVTGGVYAMYDKGYVKYAVVVGEDNTSSNNLVYITSDAVIDKTYVDKTTGYVYTYECIIDGEPTTVQVKKDAVAQTEVDGHTLYKMTYDANGYAKKVEAISGIWSSALNTTYLKDNGRAVLLNEEVTLATTGATLYVDDNQGNRKYFITDDDCTFFVFNEEGEEEYVKFTDVDDAMSETGNAKKVTGKVTILADKKTGYATTVIIYDQKFEEDLEIPDVISTIDVKLTTVDDNDVTVSVEYTGDTAPEKADALEAIEAKIVKAGYTVTGKNMNGTDYVFTAEKVESGFKTVVDFTWDGTSSKKA